MYSEYEIFGTNQQMRKVIEQILCGILLFLMGNQIKDIQLHMAQSIGLHQPFTCLLDHRKINIRMTGKAKPVLEEFEQIRADILERLFAGVTEEERSCLKRVMGKIMKNIQAEQEDGT